MFGLMTVARHEREMARERGVSMDTLALTNANAAGAIGRLENEVCHWRTLATSLAADLLAVQKAQAAAILPAYTGEPETGTIADGDFTPSAVEARRRKADG